MNDMPEYQLSASVQDGITVVIVTGKAEESSIRETARRVMEMVMEKNIQEMLIDVRAFQGRRSATDTYFRVRSYPRSFVSPRLAFVDTDENAEYQAFHELTARNAGLPVRCFTDIDVAWAWLKSKRIRADRPVKDRPFSTAVPPLAAIRSNREPTGMR
jgi:hypothetical protein